MLERMAQKYYTLRDLTAFVAESRQKLQKRTNKSREKISKLLEIKNTHVLQAKKNGWYVQYKEGRFIDILGLDDIIQIDGNGDISDLGATELQVNV